MCPSSPTYPARLLTCVWAPNCGVTDSHWLKEREPEKTKHIKNSEQAEADVFAPIEMRINKKAMSTSSDYAHVSLRNLSKVSHISFQSHKWSCFLMDEVLSWWASPTPSQAGTCSFQTGVVQFQRSSVFLLQGGIKQGVGIIGPASTIPLCPFPFES